jgi:hypothetical protein
MALWAWFSSGSCSEFEGWNSQGQPFVYAIVAPSCGAKRTSFHSVFHALCSGLSLGQASPVFS